VTPSQKSSIFAALGRLRLNQYSRDEFGRAKHAEDVQLVHHAYRMAPRNARRYDFLRDRLLITDVIKVKDNVPSTDKTYAAELDALIDKCTGAPARAR